MEAESIRAKMHDSIQTSVAGDEAMDGCMLMGYVVIAEWMHPSGDRWLSRVDGGAAGKSLPRWQVLGYLSDLQQTDWYEDGEDEDLDEAE